MKHLKSPTHAHTLFAATCPGLEEVAARELQQLTNSPCSVTEGGVSLQADLPTLARLNQRAACPNRLLLRLGDKRLVHVSTLIPFIKTLPWRDFIAPNLPIRIHASCRKSRIYHSGAVIDRCRQALEQMFAKPLSWGQTATDDATLGHDPQQPVQQIFVRLDHDQCTVSIDSSGAPLYIRGYKKNLAKAPLRDTLAASFLQSISWHPGLPLIDPMCGAATLLLEAAHQQSHLPPNRMRRFAYELWPCSQSLGALPAVVPTPCLQPSLFGFDRDQGAIAASTQNAQRAGYQERITFACQALSHLKPPPGPAGWILSNPPYGHRIGQKKHLRDLYARLGHMMRTDFAAWQLGLITSEPRLIHATGLAMQPVTAPIPHGGLKIQLWHAPPVRPIAA